MDVVCDSWWLFNLDRTGDRSDNMHVIGVASQAQHGKDTLANYLCDRLNKIHGFSYWKRIGFADEVKRVYCDTFGVTREFVEEWKVKPEAPPGFDMPVRQGLQFIGDGFRKIRGTIWVDLAFRSKIPKIISDVRYPNEFRRVHKEGGINILIGRSAMLNDDSNESEALIRPYVTWALQHCGDVCNFGGHSLPGNPPEGMDAFDLFVRNDGTIEQFYTTIDEIVVPFVLDFKFHGE